MIVMMIGIMTPRGLATAAEGKPNIVMILADDLGYGDLSSYGATDLKSPSIDALMASGVKFDNFYANCPVCSPSRASLMSGRYPELVGVPGVIRTHAADSWGYLSPKAVVIAKLLKPAGYHTGIIGKWHLGLEPENLPNARGFDHFHGFLGDMMDDYYTHLRHGNNYMRLNEKTIDPEGHATDLFTQWAIDYINQQSKTDQPFFLYLAYNAPHTPIQPPADWVKKVKAREPNITDKRAKLVALIEHMDDGIGRVVAALKQAGVYDNTLIVFSSDNGGKLEVGANNGDLRAGKQHMYEGGIRVPMGAVWPGHIKPGTSSHQIAMLMDLYPTFCEAAGVKVEHEIDGVSILPTLLGKPQQIQRDLYWVRREGNNRYQGQDYHAVRRGPWKLLHDNPFAPLELYNLADDPREEHDLAKTPANRKRFNELAGLLRRQLQRGGAVPWQKPD
ncbi:sulfatase [Planctomycetales bacterium ZRK34]|nr:sulfatase [Planctomycetales bacterium ZRK34]